MKLHYLVQMHIALLMYILQKRKPETLTVSYFPDNISYSLLSRLDCHSLSFMEVFIGQPDLLDMDLHRLQDAEAGLPVVGAHLLLHASPLLMTKCSRCF